MKKRILAMLLAIVMLIGTLPMNAFATEATVPTVVLCETEGCEYASGHEGECSNYVAPTENCTTEGCTYGANHEGDCSNAVAPIDEVTPAADAAVYVSINNAGTLALANASVTVTDINADGVLTYEEALIAAHKAYCPSGESGYYAQQSEYGSFVTTLWGVETGGSSYFFKNNVALDYGVSNTEYSAVAAGDRIYAAILADATGWSDWYTYFDKTSLTVDAGAEFTLTLNGFAAMSYGTVTTSAISGVSVGTWSNGTFAALDGKTTDANGQVTLSFDTAGTYYISASGNEPGGSPIMPPVCVVTVKEAEKPAAGLAVLKFTNGSKDTSLEYTLSPAFSSAVTEYTLTVPDSTASIYAWATLADDVSDTISVAYTNTSGTAKTVALTSGKTTGTSLSSTVKSGTFDGNTLTVTVGDVVYTVKIQRLATLSKLAVAFADTSAVTLTPTFSATTTAYSAKVPHDAVLTVTPTVKTTGAVAAVSGVAEDGTVTPAWNDLSTEITITVSGENAVTNTYTITLQQLAKSIEIQKAPAKTTYEAGETFDPTGMELKASYEGGATATILPESFTYSPTEKLSQSMSEITVTYDGLSVQQAITVKAVFEGAGTADTPYLIKTVDDLVLLSQLVADGVSFSGEYFRMTADITLPSDWTPLGVSASTPFSGNFDGDNHLLTVPEGGLPLIGTPKGASLSKLNIYGSKIAGYGVVNNYCQIGKAHAITIENVTLKSGTQTLQAGFIGGYASGTNTVTIRNCTVEQGVVIGYDRSQKWIGSFGGEFNGTIENCVSYATVYGTDFVGGIVSNKGQSMGTFTVSNCQFYGDVIATGNYVGGIVGHGYGGTGWGFSSNAGIPTITNCTATGSVSGGNYVGGIYGGDAGVVQVWDNAAGSITGNTFTGTVSATGEYKGAIIGYLKSLNKNNVIQNNAYSASCGANKGIGYVQYVDTSCETHETESGATYVNTANGKPGITGMTKTNLNRTDDPLGADAEKLCATNTGADPVDVTMTVSNKGTLALLNGSVTVTDSNGDGILTYHEALEAAHAAYCPDGYTAAESEWGISVSKIWGVETYNSLYFRNGKALANHVGNTETSTVTEGDSLLVSVNKDDTYYSDRYSSFNLTEKTVVAGVSFKLTLKAELTSGSTIVPNATIGIWKDGVFTPIEGMATGEDGNVKLTFDEVGTYIISASGTVSDTVQDWANGGAEITVDCPIIAPVCVVTVLPVPYFSDAELYTNSDAYANGDAPLEITPDFDGDVRTGYSVSAPDYQKTLYLVATISEETMANGWGSKMVMVSNNWGGWGGAAPNGNMLTRDAYFKKGYVSFYFDTGAWDEYQINVNQYTTLKNLGIDGVWDQTFDPDTTTYHVYVDGSAEDIAITPTGYKSTYAITVNGTTVTSGEAYTLSYSWDEDDQMDVEITVSTDGLTTTTYTVVLEKKPLNDAPFILKHPVEADYTVIDTSVEALRVDASASGELSYQWYWNTTDSNENGTIIDGATESTYTPPITEDVIGTRYYYCVVTNTDKTEGNVTVSHAARVTVDPDPTPVVRITNPGTDVMPDDGIAYLWDTGYYYNVGDEATELVVEATSAAPGGRYSYQWYGSNYGYGGNWSSMSGTDTQSTYTPSTSIDKANEKGIFYMCKVTYTYKGKTYESWATTGETFTDDEGVTHEMQGAYVFLKASEAPAPVIRTQPKSATYVVGDPMSRLTVSVGWSSGVSTSYQWYVSETDSTQNGVAIEGATGSWYSGLGTATEPGTKYYYCVITNKLQGMTASVTSDMAVITINSMEGILNEKLEGTGTQSDPYLIADAEDYQTVADVVASGISLKDVYLKQVADITLPANWKPIGILKDPSIGHISGGDNMYAFSGNLDGGGYTLTIPEGGLPLLGYVEGASVKNLNIYGKKIAGYGLVNNLEGVSLSGSAIVIDNVTLKSGTSTLKSGLIGTYITNNGYAGCSAGFTVTIKNCTIEKDVVIGYDKDQSMIGSFAGRINGTIENCVSYATVYGTDYVGGILGTRDNALGTYAVSNCQFHGTVVATGQHVGGIVGGGYCNSTSPNANKTNINDCTVTGSVTGADKVGGIIGGDSFAAQIWSTHTLKNNSFTGTVQATSGTYVGGIIGFYDSLNKYDDITGNYYKAGCGAERGIGYVQYVDTSCASHETVVGGTYFNTGDGTEECPAVTGCAWKKEHNRTDDPLGADAAKLCYTDEDTDPIATELKVSGTYKTEYTTGEKLDLTGIVLTVVYNDKSEKTINLSDATVTGYDANKVGAQELTISYNGLTATITVKVENPKGEIKVTVSVLGDSKHSDNGTVHTWAGGGLTTWVSATTYTVDSNSTVWDVLQKAFADNGITCNAGSGNSQGTVYISALTRNGVTLAEFDNGTNSGWMYKLNGADSDNGVAQQYLKDGDVIVFHYTDDYTKDSGGYDDEDQDAKAAEAAEKLIDAIGTVTLNSKSKIDAARKAYDNLTYTQKQLVDNYATLTAAEAKYAELNAADDEKKADAVEDLIDAIKKGSTTFEDDVKAAQKAYNNLTADQKKLVDNYYKLADYLKQLAPEEDKEAAEAVEKLIKDLGTITLESEDDIKAAREAYDKLTDEQKALVENLAVLEAAEEKLAQLKADAGIEDIYKTTGDYIENLGIPVPGSVGGEWMVIGLIRSDREVPGADDYYASVVKFVQENIDGSERLHSAKSSENSRLILALTAMGKDVTNVDGHNLLNGLNDMAFIQKQGINGPIWALIAFDSGNYPTPEGDVTREALIQVILDAQLKSGGWALSGETSDADITAMAVQALAPYYESNADVKKALDEAIETMSKMQAADGSFGSVDGTSSESISQIIVALAALGIDADKDERFIKNGISAVDALCAFYVEGGGFRHLMDGNRDGMATEQGYYALVAYFRNLDGKTGLYNMTDVIDMGGDVADEPIETEPVETEPAVTEPVEVEDEGNGFPWWIIIVILVAGVAVAVIVPVVKKKVGAK